MTHYWMCCSTPLHYTARPFLTLSVLRSIAYRYTILQCSSNLGRVYLQLFLLQGLFRQRNPGFMGTSSVIGHSLGSLILFDLLSGQTEEKEPEAIVENSPLVKPKWDKDLGIGEVFVKLGIEEHLDPFTDQGVGVEELLECGEEDLKEANLPLGPRKKLLAYLQTRKEALSGFQEFQQNSIAKRVSYSVGPAGTGQPSVRYPKLDFQPSAFFALGSPIGMFMAVRGVGSLGEGFKLPACPTFLNIFHPYDPVAYRIESLVDTK